MFKRHILILLVGLLLAASVVQAQETTAPIIAVSKTDFYAINPTDGSIKQLTNHQQKLYSDQPGSQRDLAISPDGRYMAYRQTPQFFIDALRDNLIGNYGESPSNIMLLDLSTGSETVVAEQEPDAAADNSPLWWYRSGLTWSPDSTRLIFYQTLNNVEPDSFVGLVMNFNRVTNQLGVLWNSPKPIYRLWWSGDKIFADTTVLTSAGEVVNTWYLNEGMTSGQYLHYRGHDYVVVDSADVIPHEGKLYVMDLGSGEIGMVKGLQSSISAVTPDNSLVFVKDDNDTRPRTVVNLQTDTLFTSPSGAPYATDFTFSSNGKQFAYILIDTSINISDLNGSEKTVTFDADAILWSSKQYTISGPRGDQFAPVIPTKDFDNEKNCGPLPAVGLIMGGQGRVIVGGGPNRLRRTPDKETASIGQIPEGATFTVVDGQQHVCNSGIRWAQVEYQGVTGWTAEGANGQVFLEVVQ